MSRAPTQLAFHVQYRSNSVQKRREAAAYLQRNVRVQLKLLHSLHPRLKLLRLRVDEVVEDSSLRRELDRLELGDPPFRELDTVVGKLATDG